jgi:hypothetical protein
MSSVEKHKNCVNIHRHKLFLSDSVAKVIALFFCWRPVGFLYIRQVPAWPCINHKASTGSGPYLAC